jgi:hypothetical protein
MKHDKRVQRTKSPPPVVPKSVLGWIAPLTMSMTAALVLTVTSLFTTRRGVRADGR